MKNLLRFLVISITVLVVACLAEQTNPLVIGTCYDKIKNQNEEGIDCGGVCSKCTVVIPFIVPCKDSLVNNRITLDGIDYNLTSSDFFCYQNSSGNYQLSMLIKNATEEIDIEIYGTLPTKNTIYEIVDSFDLQAGQASITYNNSFLYFANSGKLYASYANNQWTIEICSVYLYGEFHPMKFRGKISCTP